MSVKYHISSATQRPNICRAKSPETCPLREDDDGTPPPHFDSKEAAREYVEKSNEEKYGDVPTTESSKVSNESIMKVKDGLQKENYKKSIEREASFIKPGSVLFFPEDQKFHGREILRVDNLQSGSGILARRFTEISFDDGDFIRVPSTQKLVVMERKNQDSFDEASAADHVSEMRKQKELEKEEARKKARERREKNADSRRVRTSGNSSKISETYSTDSPAPKKTERDKDYSPYTSEPDALDSNEYKGKVDRFLYSSSRDELDRFGTRRAIDLMKSDYSTFDSIQRISDRASENLYKQGKTEEADRVVVQGAIHKKGKNKNYRLSEKEKTAVIRDNSPYNKALVSEIEKTDPDLVKRLRK